MQPRRDPSNGAEMNATAKKPPKTPPPEAFGI
jgi:hypothetical protein